MPQTTTSFEITVLKKQKKNGNSSAHRWQWRKKFPAIFGIAHTQSNINEMSQVNLA